MKMTRFYVTLVVLLVQQFSYAQFRKYSNEFLNIGAGARGLAMASAQVASVNDGTAGYWNPAGLVYVKDNPQLNLMHAEYFAGIGKYDYGSLAIPLKDNKRVLGLSLLRFAVDDIPNTIFLVEADGSINFSNIQTFSSADYAFLVSLAQQIKTTGKSKINAGINAKIIHRKAGVGPVIDIDDTMRAVFGNQCAGHHHILASGSSQAGFWWVSNNAKSVF
jgi:hypothetical protein